MRRFGLVGVCFLVLSSCGRLAFDGVGVRGTSQPRTLTPAEVSRLEEAIDKAAPAKIKMTDLSGRDQWTGMNLFPLFDYLDVEGQGLAIIVTHVQPVVKPPSYEFDVVACQTIGAVLAPTTCMDVKATAPAVLLNPDWVRLSLEYCHCPLLSYPDDGWVIIVGE